MVVLPSMHHGVERTLEIMEYFNSWQYNEFQPVGKDYSLPAEVEVYD